MRKLLALCLAAGLVVASLTTAEAAGKKSKRVAKAEYIAPAYFYWAPTGDNIGGASFPTGPSEKFVSVQIKDRAGTPVSAGVGQDPEGDGTVTTTRFCTKTEKPVAITPGLEITVFVFVGPCTEPMGPGFATQGEIIATFTSTR